VVVLVGVEHIRIGAAVNVSGVLAEPMYINETNPWHA